MSTNHNRIKVVDLETNDPNKILKTNQNGELEFSDVENDAQPKLTDENFGAFQDSLQTVNTIADTDKMPFLIGSLARMMTWANFKSLFKTVGGNSIFGNGNIATPDMDTTTSQTVSGVKTFLNLMLGLRNSANTFTSFITNTATASRTWTFPDKSGTVAMTSDITGVINAGTTNRIPKYVGSTVVGNSRILDDGTYIGLDVTNTPTKDLTFGNQNTRTLGIEDSDSSTSGRDLSVSAGRTINFQLTANFIDLNQSSRPYKKGYAAPNGDYFIPSDATIYKQIGGTGNLVIHATLSYNINSVAISSTNDLYVSTTNGLYKQTNSTGGFTLENEVTNREYFAMSFHPSGHLYAVCACGDTVGSSSEYIYKRRNNTGDFTTEITSVGRYNDVACAPNGDVYVSFWSVGLLKQTGGNGTWSTVYSTNSLGSVCVLENGTIYTCNVFQSIAPKFAISTNNGFSFSTSAVDLPFGTHLYCYLSANKNNVYLYRWSGSSVFFQSNDALGAPDLDGGTYKIKSGTGKGTGKSRVEFYTGQKTVSGTDMQVEKMRVYLDENGNFIYLTPPSYANDTEADADSNLPSKAFYKITGNRTVFQKP